MNFESVKSVYYLYAGFFHLLAPADVVLFVKPCAKLNKRHYLLAVLGGSYESAYYLAVSCDAVKRYFYRRNIGVVCRFFKQTQKILEFIIGV